MAKAERKGRTQAEVDEIIGWLTGYGSEELEKQLETQVDFETLLRRGPRAQPVAGFDHGRDLWSPDRILRS